MKKILDKIHKYLPYIILVFLILIGLLLLMTMIEQGREEETYKATLNECQLADYEIKKSHSSLNQTAKELHKQNLLLQGKCL